MLATFERITHYCFWLRPKTNSKTKYFLSTIGVITLLVFAFSAPAAAQSRPKKPSPFKAKFRAPSLSTFYDENNDAPPPPSPPPLPPSSSCSDAVNYADATYGSIIRQMARSSGHEHNIYYHRNVWNADNSYMIGIRSDLNEQNWNVVLYDGYGCYTRDLFPISQYNWQLSWDRNNPAILYSNKNNGSVYRINVMTSQSDLLKSFSAFGGLHPQGPTLNQAGDRILLVTFDGFLRSFSLSDMGDERAFAVAPLLPANCKTDWNDIRYTGYKNYIGINCSYGDGTGSQVVVEDTGKVLYTFTGIGGANVHGHYDYSPNGKFAYSKKPHNSKESLEIHVVNIDGTDDRILYSVPYAKASYVSNLHVSWPDKVADWFVVSVFPTATPPSTYASPLDEILKIHLNGSFEYVARSGSRPKIAGSSQQFWAQPLASPSADGSRISFNSNCPANNVAASCVSTGTIDQYILFMDSQD